MPTHWRGSVLSDCEGKDGYIGYLTYSSYSKMPIVGQQTVRSKGRPVPRAWYRSEALEPLVISMPSLPSESVRKATDRSREKPRKRLLDWPRTALVGSLLSASSRLTGREEKRSLD
ncbi:hypothetical protein WN943_029126 [Citrus x changshan-huyou]